MKRLKVLLYPEKNRMQFLYLTISGLLSGFCMAFPSAFSAIIEWISFIPVALAIYSAIDNKCSLRSAYWGAFWLIYSQNVIVYHWFISFYPLEFTGMTKLAAAGVVIVAIFGLALLAAIFGGVAGLITALVSRTGLAKKFPILMPFVAASAYVLNEWIRTQFWFGVPWGRLSLGQLTDGVPYTVLSSSLFGSYFVTFLIVLVSFMLAQAFRLEKIRIRTILAASLVIANLICGFVLYYIPDPETDTIRVAAIQGNISSRDKWSEDDGNKDKRTSFEIHIDLSIEAAQEGADLIVWSETTILNLMDYQIGTMSELCRTYETNILFGSFDYDENGKPQNVLLLIDSNGELSENVYVKRHLVPYGEYVPMRKLVTFIFPPLAEIGMLSEDLVEGENSELFTIVHNGKEVNLGGLICFDSIYESLAYSSASDGAEILCVSTNDSWFEDSRAVYMHCAQSRLRAIETRLPVVRSANTGVSAIITSDGEVIETLEPLVSGFIVSDVAIGESGRSSSAANITFIIMCALLLLAFPVSEIVKICRKTKK